jgi:hypothetical protein
MEISMKPTANSIRQEIRVARKTWGDLGARRLRDLRSLLVRYKFSIILGEITRIDGRWYVTHSGLLHLASRRKCRGIRTSLQERVSDPAANRWVFRAVVYKSPNSKGFAGYGDADPSNTSPLVRGAEMRIAETRAVNRALRKAYGIGLCSIEELGSFSTPSQSFAAPPHSNEYRSSNGSNNGQPRLRDQLCLLVRQYNLDPSLVKAYAADFCGTATLKEASRDLVESFISELATAAKNDWDSLLCKLNSYAQPAEVKA